jgi:hypothetical protein
MIMQADKSKSAGWVITLKTQENFNASVQVQYLLAKFPFIQGWSVFCSIQAFI